MPESLSDLERRRAAVQSQIAQLGDMRSGSITGTGGRCGNPNCHCHQTQDPGHGPYYRLTRKVNGKTVTETFSTPAIPAIPVPARRLDTFAAHGKEVVRRDRSQVGIPRDLVRPPASPFGEISFGQGLQVPGDPPEEMFPVPRSHFFLKYLPILLAQSCQALPAQVLNCYQYRSVQLVFLSVGVNHSPMNALCRPTGKGNSEKPLTTAATSRHLAPPAELTCMCSRPE